MDPRLGWRAKKRKRRRLKQATFEAIVNSAHSDPAKARVMGYFRELVADGLANWQALENGTIRLRLNTGETYLLDKTTITRIV
jgi:hypothetical protein